MAASLPPTPLCPARPPSALTARTAHLLDLLDHYHPATAAHSRRVAALCRLVAGDAYYEPALLHDIGKIDGGIRALLDLPRRLTPDERREVQLHPLLGVALLEIQSAWTAVPALCYEMCQSHHERWDGTGYPEGLAGNAIPWAARLCALVDAFDSMTADAPARPYRLPLTVEAAVAELRQGAGTQFDPALVEPVVAVIMAHAADAPRLEETA